MGPAQAPSSEGVSLTTDGRRGVDPSEQTEQAEQLEMPLAIAAAACPQLMAADAEAPSRIAIAGFVALLHRHTLQNDLTVCMLDERRVLQLKLEDSPSFAAVLDSLHTARITRITTEAPSSNVGFDFSDGTRTRATRPDLPALLVEHRLDLLLSIEWPRADGTDSTLRLIYDPRLFRFERIRELALQYRALLNQAIAQPLASIFDHSLITSTARALLPDPTLPLAEPMHRPIGEIFRARAADLPHAAAICKDGRTWSYRELALRSVQIALQLRARCAIGDVVAVTGERSFALVSAMLGVLQSGAVLLTLDPKLPVERRRLMLEQARAKLVLCVGAHDALPEPAPTTIDIAAESGEFITDDALGAAPSLPAIDPESAAYVFFTSGSTGVPKAVRGTHRGLAHFLAWQRREFGVQPGDRASQLTALSFDVVLRDMFLALTSGATLCIPDEAAVIDPAQILVWLARERVSVVHVVPSLARLWLSHVPSGLVSNHVRLVFFAGEPLTDVLVQRFRAVFGSQVQIVNLYGPTETTLAKCFQRVATEPEPGVQAIGRPLPQTQVWILNRSQQLCGLHEVGEIAIRTPFRSLGYLNNPEATERAFVPNPFRDDPRDLVYLTGDSGCYRADGKLEILGRIDAQVKIRGVRIEPGEIEAALGHHAQVREAVVVAREDTTGTKILVAYVVPNSSAEAFDPSQLRAFLRTRLPDAMIPSAFVCLPVLPLNANGKVDKRALPAFDHGAANVGQLAAANDSERELAEIWREVLGVPSVSVDESFYDLGGDSLTAIRVIIRMRVLGFDEAICRAILQGKTIAEIARALEAGDAVDAPRAANADSAPAAHVRLLLHVVRGLLILLLIVNHFTPSLARRSAFVNTHHKYLSPLYNTITPGFAIAFGITLGFIYYPQYQKQPRRAFSLLWRGSWLVGIAAASFDLASWAVGALLQPNAPHDHPLDNALSYYFLALATAVVWFKLISVWRSPAQGALALSLSSGVVQHVLPRLAWSAHARGWWILLFGKYGYFSLTIGAMLGLAIGVQLKRAMKVARRYVPLGAMLMTAGAVWSLQQPVSIAWLTDQTDIATWKWLFYGGLTLWLLTATDRVLMLLPARGFMRTLARWVGVFGQLSLPLFILHYFARYLGDLCTAIGLPSTARFSVEFGALIVVSYVWARRTYRLFYGGGAQHAHGNARPITKPALRSFARSSDP